MKSRKTGNKIDVSNKPGVNGVEYNQAKGQYRAVLNDRHSLWFDSVDDAQMLYELAKKDERVFKLNFPDYLR